MHFCTYRRNVLCMADLLTATQVAERLGVSKSAVYAWANRGVLPVIRLGGLVKFREQDVDRLLTPTTDDAA